MPGDAPVGFSETRPDQGAFTVELAVVAHPLSVGLPGTQSPNDPRKLRAPSEPPLPTHSYARAVVVPPPALKVDRMSRSPLGAPGQPFVVWCATQCAPLNPPPSRGVTAWWKNQKPMSLEPLTA